MERTRWAVMVMPTTSMQTALVSITLKFSPSHSLSLLVDGQHHSLSWNYMMGWSQIVCIWQTTYNNSRMDIVLKRVFIPFKFLKKHWKNSNPISCFANSKTTTDFTSVKLRQTRKTTLPSCFNVQWIVSHLPNRTTAKVHVCLFYAEVRKLQFDFGYILSGNLPAMM